MLWQNDIRKPHHIVPAINIFIHYNPRSSGGIEQSDTAARNFRKNSLPFIF